MTQTLLLVDDEPNILRALTRMLRRDGYKILTAGSGLEGLEVVRGNPDIEVIISDQRMPEMSGVEFLSQVKELHPSIIRIILSGFSDLTTIIEAINKGAIFRFISKPWDDEILRNNVKDAFRHYHLYTLSEADLSVLQHTTSKPALLSSILDELPQAVLAIDDQQRILYSNQMANTVFSRDDLLYGLVITDATAELSQLVTASAGPITISGDKYQLTINKGRQENRIFTLSKIVTL